MTVATLEPQNTAALAIRPGQEMWDPKQRAALAAMGVREAPNAELAVFLHYCQKTALDPFSRQIYLIKRREKQGDQWVDKWTIQVGIDGFRVIRDRVAERLGVTVEYEDTIWYDRDGGEHKIWLRDDEPAGVNVTVLKNGRRFPGVVRFAAYAARNKNGDLVSQWKTQGDHMIEKCAEAFALRRAFPNDLGGLYIPEEMPPVTEGQGVIRQRGRVTVADIVQKPASQDEDRAAAGGTPDDGSAASRADLGDWGALIDSISSPEDSVLAEEQLDEALTEGVIDPDKADAVRAAIRAKVNLVSQPAQNGRRP